MNRQTLLKFAQVLLIILVAVGLDQWTKHIASTRLATARGGFQHYIHLTVPPEFDGKTVKEYLAAEFMPTNTEDELQRIIFSTTNDAAVAVRATDTVHAGDKLEVRWREVVVIPDHWDYQYTRNPGAAFSFLAGAPDSVRAPFFIVISILAVLVILWILRGVRRDQQLLIFALSFVCGGAIGNLIDRVRFGYVIDFVVWKWTDVYRWPTFNIADSFIVVGVSLMLIEMLIDGIKARKLEKSPEAETTETSETP